MSCASFPTFLFFLAASALSFSIAAFARWRSASVEGKGPIEGLAVENEGVCVLLLLREDSARERRVKFWIEDMGRM